MKQLHWFLCVAKNCDWSRKITPLSNLTGIELRNLKILKKMLEKSSQFLSSEQLCEPKSLDVALKIAGVEKYSGKSYGCHQPRGNLIRVLNERSLNDGGDLCLLWLVILKSV